MASTESLTRDVPGTPYNLKVVEGKEGTNCIIYKGEHPKRTIVTKVALREYFVFEEEINIPTQLRQFVIDSINQLARDYKESLAAPKE